MGGASFSQDPLAKTDLVDCHLVDSHLGGGHLADRYLFGNHLGNRYLVYKVFGQYNAWPMQCLFNTISGQQTFS
jgi:hypothetical protein